ncbi:hypothetical protein ABET15_15525 [Heyndrickxia faecalis]|jgi:hypothetical protein|uniref:Uncharacterized protein n=1 Tax=Heyndrickxia coagulans TaxID=1398 RepID=A0A0C5C7T1_HEYCO|nr:MULTISPECIES: hypothetical protein [Heyndrickxia]AJO24418.1 hypothetical protein SB48_HM08orf05763 [Heyndrickxia coagulans]AKN54123.1 hypothetical protein AB434_1718 [Heyndrickxia coagulans]KWZ85987.1 hypothetical protein HMPREF3213_00229 [Heyndrickxia coagulans]MEC2305516.1 hypothetical protein [Weizmannia sp. CD-2023]MED4323013.1 hypothetical protein [Weizmannia sp. CD-2023]
MKQMGKTLQDGKNIENNPQMAPWAEVPIDGVTLYDLTQPKSK